MKQIKVLGSGCKKCTKTADSIERIAHDQGVEVTVTKGQMYKLLCLIT